MGSGCHAEGHWSPPGMAQVVNAGNADMLRGRFGGVDMARTGIQ